MRILEFAEKIGEKLIRIKKPVSAHLEAAGILKALDGRPVLFEKIKESEFPVLGNLFSTRELIADYFGVKKRELTHLLLDAIEKPSKPEQRRDSPWVEMETDLGKLPILFHCEKDGGKYISSAIVIARDEELGQNCSFHRMMVVGKDKVTLRILPRHLDEFLKRAGGELDVGVVIGNPPNILLAAATSVELGRDEMEIANSLEPLETVKLENGIEVPASSEFVFLGRITKELGDEGRFVDLTETYDIVRKQPVMEIKKILRRKDAVYQALLPGGLEHKILMGMPREPTIFREVSKVCECTGVNITPGGCSWLHAVVQIRKRSEEDGKNAIEAAFRGHRSMKHVVIVDEDIDIYDPNSVEWAIATRFQADKQALIKPKEKGSSLDPSADPVTRETCKVGIDATKPLVAKGKDFTRAEFPKVDLEKFLE